MESSERRDIFHEDPQLVHSVSFYLRFAASRHTS